MTKTTSRIIREGLVILLILGLFIWDRNQQDQINALTRVADRHDEAITKLLQKVHPYDNY